MWGAKERLRVWILVVGVMTLLLIVFLVVEGAGVPLLVDPRPALDAGSAVAATIGVGLLAVDAVAPVPSSVVMVALGARFGFVGGVLLSIVGSISGFAVGYLIGRWSRGTLSPLVGGESDRAAALLRRWGVLAVVVSRPVPLLAETVSFVAGAFAMRPLAAFGASALGSVGPAAAFAYAGSRGASTVDDAIVFVVVAGAAGLCWVAGRRLSSSDSDL